jgi:hypothetical protein
MAVREVIRRGKRILFIDIHYRKPDGTREHFRRDSEAVTKTAARDEERRIRDLIARTGSPLKHQRRPRRPPSRSRPSARS